MSPEDIDIFHNVARRFDPSIRYFRPRAPLFAYPILLHTSAAQDTRDALIMAGCTYHYRLSEALPFGAFDRLGTVICGPLRTTHCRLCGWTYGSHAPGCKNDKT